MNERSHPTAEPGSDRREERLRALYERAYQPVEPSEALRRRVAGAAARSLGDRGRPTRLWWRGIAWGLAGVGAVLLVALLVPRQAPSGSGSSPHPPGPSGSRPHPPAPSPNAGRGGAEAASALLPPLPALGEGGPGGEGGTARGRQASMGGSTTRRRGGESGTAQGGQGGEGGTAEGGPGNERGSGTPSHTGDLPYLNSARQEATGLVPAGLSTPIQAPTRPRLRRGDDFVYIPPPRLVDASDSQIAAAVASQEREAAIVDGRLAREVTLAQKAIALSDLCDHLRSETGIRLAAGASVADEKVTVFCRKRPLREVMRQLSRPFGYLWLRSGKSGDYRYELVQDLKSQLMEEELRNRDRNAALIALHEEMERYRPYIHLSPDEALAASRTATPAEKPLLERLGGHLWAPIQMYFRLSPGDTAALRAGRAVTFRQDAEPGQPPLPPDVARGALQSHRDVRLRDDPDDPERPQFGNAESLPDGVPPVSYPRARARVDVMLRHLELGRYTMNGNCGVHIGTQGTTRGAELASGVSPAVRNPENARQNARWSQDADLRARVSLTPQPGPRTAPAAGRSPGSTSDLKVTSADVLEALHRASGRPIVADYYTRLYPAEQLAVHSIRLFDALNRLADTMCLRWSREKGSPWLQLRSASYYDDRMKEVPNRLLPHWAAARRQRGHLTLDDLCEIVQLTDAQLNSDTMAEGARELFGLQEWDLARSGFLRQHLRYLANLTPEQRRATMSGAGLPFGQLTLAQQQHLVAHIGNRVPSLEALSQIAIRVVYLQPGEFQWVQPETSEFRGPNRAWPTNFFGIPTVRDRTREAVLQAARRIDPNADPSQIRPTELWMAVMYRRANPPTGELMEWGLAGTERGGRVNW
jgi:hypothetical protein